MGIVHGPYNAEDWYTMLMLRDDMKWMKEKGSDKYHFSIRWTKGQLKEYLTKQAA